MAITREEVVLKAKELSLTLTDEQVDKYVSEGKLPEKPAEPSTKIKELLDKFSPEQLARMVQELREENAGRRISERDLKAQAEELTRKIQGLENASAKFPELENELKSTRQAIENIKVAEKKRREQTLAKMPEEKRSKISYLLDVDKVDAASFESTVELVLAAAASGAQAGSPTDPPQITLTPEEKREASRMGLSEEAFLDIQKKRKGRAPVQNQPQASLSRVS